MPVEAADRLLEIEIALLKGAGASDKEANIVARHSIDSNLAGHDSHGIIKIPTYQTVFYSNHSKFDDRSSFSSSSSLLAMVYSSLIVSGT